MVTIDVPVAEWPEFLEAFSRQHRAWLTTVEPSAAPDEDPQVAVHLTGGNQHLVIRIER